MTKSQIQLAREKVISETHKRPKLGKWLKNKEISRLGELLLFAQVLLDKIEIGENDVLNSSLYGKIINFYCAEMEKYD